MSYLPAALINLAQEEAQHGERSGLFLILPEPAELIWGAASFIVLLLFVWKRVTPALRRVLDARQEAIKGQLVEAEKAKTEAQSLLEDYRRQLADARNEGNRILEESRQASEAMRSEMIAKAQAETQAMVEKGREEAAAERVRALAEVRQEVANISINLAEKVLGKNLDRQAQLGLVEGYLADLERM